MKRLRAMSFNIRHGLGLDGQVDLERIAEVIAAAAPDIVALQEVDRYMQRSGYMDQADELSKSLGMNWCYAASIRRGRSEYGNAILSHGAALEHQVTFLPGEKERRTLLQARLHTAQGPILALTTHLGVTERDRNRQIPLLVQQSTTIHSAAEPAILMGDFNMEADHPLFDQIRALGWRFNELQTSGKGTVVGGGTIDHILTHGMTQETKVYTIPTAASDHCPVVLEIG